MPVNMTMHAERLAADYGGEVVWTKLSTSSLMAAACDEGVALGVGERPGIG